MGSEIDIMRILGNIEGKLDGMISSADQVRDQVGAIHKDLQAHKEEDARDKNRIIGAGIVVTILWSVITFFSDVFFKVTGGHQ